MPAIAEAESFLEIGDIARSVGLSISRVRQLEIEHKIPAAVRTSTGRRLYTARDIEVIRAARAAQHREDTAVVGR